MRKILQIPIQATTTEKPMDVPVHIPPPHGDEVYGHDNIDEPVGSWLELAAFRRALGDGGYHHKKQARLE